jgi:NAD(P)-dependent dehydrogenase (short-subunit alcohol dehydrogenase family)
MHVRELFDLSGRTAIVTGGTGLYGTPMSEALAEAGAFVIIASRNKTRCEEWAAKLVGRGLKAGGESYDQASTESILAFSERILKRHGAVDILVNNSVGRSMRSYGAPLDDWRQSMEVNATGLFTISRAFLDPMMKRKQGTVINIGSVQGVVAPDFSNYAGTNMTTPPDYQFHKHGLVGLTKYLAAWAGPSGVRVNTISPGGYNPEVAKEPFLSQYNRRVFLGRMAEYDDIKGVALFLASEASRYITGQNILLDGGYCI